MSVFKKLRGRFQTAQQGLFDGLRSVNLFEGHLKADQLEHVKSKDIDLNAGADLLFDYQETWADFQNETKLCSEKAETVGRCLSPMFRVWDRRGEDVTALEEEVRSIPIVMSAFKDMQVLLDNIRQEFSVVEASLSVLENLCEEMDLKKAMEDETGKLHAYQKLKEKEAEKTKVSLAQEHARHMQQFETSRTLKLKERADAFTVAFEEDVDYYRTHGQTESKLVPEFPKVSSLSEIDLEEDSKDLDTFLGPQTDEDQGGGEAEYFEDDYTADFSVKKDLEAPDEDDRKASITLSGESCTEDDQATSERILQEKGAYPDSYLVCNDDVADDVDEEGDVVNKE